MIEIRNLTKTFRGTPAVADVSLDLPAGDSIALWGPNGAGKTTLIRCVLGLLAFKGSISIGGHDVRRDGKAARLLIGYVPQELGFYDELGVAESLGFFGRLKGVSDCSSEEILAHVGLTGHGRKRIRELSGGMKQRLALAIALLGDPPVLVLDEVTASLDALGREEFVALLARLRGSGRTMIFASHRVEEVAALARRVAVLERGRLDRIVTCGEFIAAADRKVVLHLTMPEDTRGRAMTLLRSGGFDPRLNGVGILVPVTPDRKAAPFRLLTEASVRIDDFELVDPTLLHQHTHASRGDHA